MDSSSSSSESSTDFSPAEVFAGSLMEQINKTDVVNMVGVQRDMLSRFEKTNEMLINFNILSANRYAIVSQDFKKHTTLMYDMKKDLDTIFKRIRVLKQRLGVMYPGAFKATGIHHGASIEHDTNSLPSTSNMEVPVHEPTNPAPASAESTGAVRDPQGMTSTHSSVSLPGVSPREPSVQVQGPSTSASHLSDSNVSRNGATRKTLWEKEKLLVTSNFSFSHNVFKRHLLQRRQKSCL